MSNTEAWDRLAARHPVARATGIVEYGPDLPTDADLRLCGSVAGKRVLEIGCGAGANAVAFAQQGAHVIAVDCSATQLARARALADDQEVRVEWHHGDAADLAFLRADSIDLAFSTRVFAEVEDADRLLRQVHRVLRPGAAFVCAYDHPLSLIIGRHDNPPGALPFGDREVSRSYFEPGPMAWRVGEETLTLWPRTIADMSGALHRAGYRVDALLEPEPMQSSDAGPAIPTTILWRARKEGV